MIQMQKDKRNDLHAQTFESRKGRDDIAVGLHYWTNEKNDEVYIRRTRWKPKIDEQKFEFRKNLMEQDDEIDEDLTTFSKKVLRLPLIK